VKRVVHRVATAQQPSAAYDLLADFSLYPQIAPSVLRVDVFDESDANGLRYFTSAWEVVFRNGTLAWVERDVFDSALKTVTFSQISGDLEQLRGEWSVRENGPGSEVRFEAEFDLGLPGLDAFLEPVAQRALEENVRDLMTGLFADARVEGEGSRCG
jgi:ribosome-associated toxin RatA of RatAB toxin-antitoxin module